MEDRLAGMRVVTVFVGSRGREQRDPGRACGGCSRTAARAGPFRFRELEVPVDADALEARARRPQRARPLQRAGQLRRARRRARARADRRRRHAALGRAVAAPRRRGGGHRHAAARRGRRRADRRAPARGDRRAPRRLLQRARHGRRCRRSASRRPRASRPAIPVYQRHEPRERRLDRHRRRPPRGRARPHRRAAAAATASRRSAEDGILPTPIEPVADDHRWLSAGLPPSSSPPGTRPGRIGDDGRRAQARRSRMRS